jgi:hypothetical protein
MSDQKWVDPASYETKIEEYPGQKKFLEELRLCVGEHVKLWHQQLELFQSGQLQGAKLEDVNFRGNHRSATIGALAGALAKAQGQIQNPPKDRVVNIRSDKGTYSYRYADLASCLDAIRKPFSENGLSITQAVTVENARATCVTELLHSSGEWLRSEIQVTASNAIKDLGGQYTYLRRYALSALVGIAPDDDADERDDSQPSQPASKTPAAARAKQAEAQAKAETKPAPENGSTARNAPTGGAGGASSGAHKIVEIDPKTRTPKTEAKPERTQAEKDAQPIFDQLAKTTPTAEQTELARLKKQLMGLIMEVDVVLTPDGKPDNAAMLAIANGRCFEWELPSLPELDASQLELACRAYRNLRSQQLELMGLIQVNDAVFNKKTGEIDESATRLATKARLVAYEEQNPGTLPEGCLTARPIQQWHASAEQLKTIRSIYEAASTFEPPAEEGAPF